jgi:hypothetical protein
MAGVLSTAVYGFYALTTPGGPSGGTWAGLAFAFAGTGVIVFECLLSLRKKYPASPFGRVRTWLRAHIWLGLLAFLLILFHTGFQWRGGLGSVLMWMFVLITASGIYGLALQQYLPRLMTERVPRETIYEEIPAVINQMRLEADERIEYITADLGFEEKIDPEAIRAVGEKINMVLLTKELEQRKSKPVIPIDADATEVLRRHYLSDIRPFLFPEAGDRSVKLFGSANGIGGYFRRLRTLLPVAAHDVVSDVEQICDERRQLAVQQRLHHWLHAWLYLHVPLSMAFLVLVALHAVWSLRY